MRYATLNGFICRFDTTFINFTQDETGVTTLLRDKISGSSYQVRSKYLFGADGARGEVLRQLDLPLDIRPDQGLAFNVHFRADLSNHMKYRPGVLHWLFQPDKQHPDFGWSCIARMVKPWYEWMFIVLPERGKELTKTPSEEEWCNRMREFIGNDSIPVELLDVSKWRINDVVAEKYSKGRVYVLHVHNCSSGLSPNIYLMTDSAWEMPFIVTRHQTAWARTLASRTLTTLPGR